MSLKPIPVAETAALLMMLELQSNNPKRSSRHIASLASRLHRIAPAAQWISEAACGMDHPYAEEMALGVSRYDGSDEVGPYDPSPRVARETAVYWEEYAYKKAARTNKSLNLLADELKPLDISLTWGGDLRGAALTLTYANGREYRI